MKAKLFVVSLVFNFNSWKLCSLNGNYTIDNSQVTAGSNFNSWSDFTAALVSNGIDGPVTVDVMSNYVVLNQVVVPHLKGSSAVNTITIRGHNKYLESIQNDAVLVFKGADYVTIDSLIVRNTSTSTSAIGIRIYDTANYNRIENCTIEFTKYIFTNYNLGAFIAISGGVSNLTTKSGGQSFNNMIVGNLMRTTDPTCLGPSFGILVFADDNTSSASQNNVIYGNKIENFHQYGILIYFCNSATIKRNSISRINASKNIAPPNVRGISVMNGSTSGGRILIDSNEIHDLPSIGSDSTILSQVEGIYIEMITSTALKPIVITNNTIHSIYNVMFFRGIIIESCAFVNVSKNTIRNVYTAYQLNTYKSNFSGIILNAPKSTFRVNGNIITNCVGGATWNGIVIKEPTNIIDSLNVSYNSIDHIGGKMDNHFGIYSTQSIGNSQFPLRIFRNSICYNKFNSNDASHIYIVYEVNQIITQNKIDSNRIQSAKYSGIFLFGSGKTLVTRNMISNNVNFGNAFSKSSMNKLFYKASPDILNNIIANNSARGEMYGIDVTSTYSGAYTANVIQNTIIFKSKYADSANLNVSPFLLRASDQNAEFSGNLIEVQNFNECFMSFVGKQTTINYNTFHIYPEVFQNWQIDTKDIINDAKSFIDSINGIDNYIPEYGMFFTPRFESRYYRNQNNFPSVYFNKEDFYGNSRTGKCDRGAVEYNGSVNIETSFFDKRNDVVLIQKEEVDVAVINGWTNFSIIDISGKLVMNCTNENDRINFSNVSNGMYFIINNDNDSFIKAIVHK